MNGEKQAIRIKFVTQGVDPYEKEIDEIDELTKEEKVEFLEIYLRLKKGNFYKRVMIEELIEVCPSEEMKEKAKTFIKKQ